MKSWKTLTFNDFVFDEEEGVAQKEFNQQELLIQIPNREFLSERNIAFCIEALAEWLANVEATASIVQKRIRTFLPGRVVIDDELSLWMLAVYEPGGNPKPPIERLGKPEFVTFSCQLLGDYSDPKFDLGQFNESSTIEVTFPVNTYVIDWSDPCIDTTNDFA